MERFCLGNGLDPQCQDPDLDGIAVELLANNQHLKVLQILILLFSETELEQMISVWRIELDVDKEGNPINNGLLMMDSIHTHKLVLLFVVWRYCHQDNAESGHKLTPKLKISRTRKVLTFADVK